VLLRLRPEPPSFDAATRLGATAFRKAQPRETPAAESEMRMPQIDRATAGAARSRFGPWRRPITAGLHLVEFRFQKREGFAAGLAKNPNVGIGRRIDGPKV